MNKESATAILSTLMQRHQNAAKYYRAIAARAKHEEMKGLMQSLEQYHSSLEKEILEQVPTIMDIPMTSNEKSKILSDLDNEVTELDEAISSGNAMKVYTLCHDEESDISDYYKTSMQQVGIPEGIMELLEKQADKTATIVQRLERGSTVPTEKNILVDVV